MEDAPANRLRLASRPPSPPSPLRLRADHNHDLLVLLIQIELIVQQKNKVSNVPEVHVRRDSLGPAKLLLCVFGGGRGGGGVGPAAVPARRDGGTPRLLDFVLEIVVPLILLREN